MNYVDQLEAGKSMSLVAKRLRTMTAEYSVLQCTINRWTLICIATKKYTIVIARAPVPDVSETYQRKSFPETSHDVTINGSCALRSHASRGSLQETERENNRPTSRLVAARTFRAEYLR